MKSSQMTAGGAVICLVLLAAIFYAAAQPDECTLSYDLNGGEGEAPEDITCIEGDTVRVSFDSMYYKGSLAFYGWSEDPDAELPEFDSGCAGKKALTVTDDTVLYAVYGESSGHMAAGSYLKFDGRTESAGDPDHYLGIEFSMEVIAVDGMEYTVRNVTAVTPYSYGVRGETTVQTTEEVRILEDDEGYRDAYEWLDTPNFGKQMVYRITVGDETAFMGYHNGIEYRAVSVVDGMQYTMDLVSYDIK